MKNSPVLLCIMDGWGLKTGLPGDALSLAKLPNFDRLMASCPHSQLAASGLAVGLPQGLMGNSEVGHLNIGAGRVVYQDLTSIDKAIAEGEFAQNAALLAACQAAKAGSGRLHLLGLLSDGGVHSHFQHLLALLELAQAQGVPQTFVHCFLDGRDVPPTSGAGYLQKLAQHLSQTGYGQLGVVCGRFWAMDRDKRWERVAKAWRALVLGEGQKTPAAALPQAVTDSYAAGVTDEFVEPLVPDTCCQIGEGDGVIFYNFRADRAREITRALTEPDFAGFERPLCPRLHYCCMTEYDESFTLAVAFPRQAPRNGLGEVAAAAGLRQLRIAETEKYAHVTFFFNGGVEEPNPGEERILIPSTREVPTYDLKPEMSAPEVCDKVVAAILSRDYDLIILNFANPDMVGHTGVIPAAVKAVETVDGCLARIVAALEETGGVMLLTADHGNVERLLDEDGQPVTSHTTSPVPVLLVNGQPGVKLAEGGALCDLAPTLLELLKLPQPAEMTGHSLLVR